MAVKNAKARVEMWEERPEQKPSDELQNAQCLVGEDCWVQINPNLPGPDLHGGHALTFPPSTREESSFSNFVVAFRGHKGVGSSMYLHVKGSKVFVVLGRS